MVTTVMNVKDTPWKQSYDKPRQPLLATALLAEVTITPAIEPTTRSTDGDWTASGQTTGKKHSPPISRKLD